MQQRLFLIRHGETPFNRAKRYCGITDVTLTDKGTKQAKVLRGKFQRIRIDAIYTSPLRRTCQTAQMAFGSKMTLQPVSALKELNFGKWEGLTLKQIINKYPTRAKHWLKQPFKTKIPQGESISYLKNRVMDFIRQLITNQKHYRNIALVTHSGPIRVIISEILGLGSMGYWHVNPTLASATKLCFKDNNLVEYSIL